MVHKLGPLSDAIREFAKQRNKETETEKKVKVLLFQDKEVKVWVGLKEEKVIGVYCELLNPKTEQTGIGMGEWIADLPEGE